MRYFILTILLFVVAVYIFLVAAVNDKNQSFRDFSNKVMEDSLAYASTNPFISRPLKDSLLSFINHQNNLAFADSTYSRHISYWINFYKKEGKCYVELLADFNFYSSKKLNGFTSLRDKYITIYGIESQCGNQLIDPHKLKTGRIKDLIDTDYADWTDTIPPPPPPPHEPYRRLYSITSNNDLELVYNGM